MQFSELKNIKRFKDIITILAKYGFQEIVQRMDVPGADLVRKMSPTESDSGVYVRIRRAIEDLGPTFIKFGQIMSLRPDLLPKALLVQLEKLQDDVPALALDDIETVVLESLKESIDNVFSVFDVEPVAAASLSQVHRAVLKKEGHIVSVKIQRPDIRKKIESDLDILETMANFLDQKFDELKAYNLPELVEVIRRHLMTETDFTAELRNMKIARSFSADTPIYIAEGYETYSTDKVLVMEFVQGARYSELLPGSPYDGERIAKQGLAAATKQILEDGFFHADPHPGNLLITKEMNLCIIDWGMVGRLTENDRFELTELLRSIVDRDTDALTHSLIRLCQRRGADVQQKAMERDVLAILDATYAVPIKEIKIGQLLMDIMALIRNHQMQLPTDYVIMIKALVTAEGSARQAYADLDVVSEIRDRVMRLAKERFRPEIVWRNLRNTFSNLWSAQRDIPRQIQQIIGKLENGELGFNLHLNRIEQLVNSLENASNRLTTAIITAAIIMGSSMIITTGIGPYLFGFPALGVIGYLLSVVLGLWLIITIIGKKNTDINLKGKEK
ncbi:ABC1 kinase family protein [Desulfosarcina sp.]|uniref:ABC1 kinase family protein n=1 Tax=Desulfosarcina sp. TaxID=2027861 RepID=UPI00356344B6